MTLENSSPKISAITDRKKNIVKILLAGVLAVFVVLKVDWEYLKSMGERLSFWWAFLSLLLVMLMTVLKSLQYQVLINKGLRFNDVLKTVVWQNTIANFIANSAGVASYMTMLKTEQNINLRRSGVVFLIAKLGDFLVISFYLGLASIFTWEQTLPLRGLTIFLLIGMLIGLILFFVVVWLRESFVDNVEILISWLTLDRWEFVQKSLRILRSLAQEKQKKIFAMLRVSIVLSFIYMLATMAYSWANIKVFDVQIGLWPVIYVAAIRQLISYVPLQILGGLGVTEVTSVYLYSIFGLDQGKMSAVMLGLRVLFYARHAIIFLYIPLETFFQKVRDART